jgi:hypothetical protein
MGVVVDLFPEVRHPHQRVAMNIVPVLEGPYIELGWGHQIDLPSTYRTSNYGSLLSPTRQAQPDGNGENRDMCSMQVMTCKISRA